MSEDWPIVSVVVVSDVTRCPAGFTVIDRTYDRREEADLWRDGLFGRRVVRYLCVEKVAPSAGRDVLVDVVVINERDPLPAGFTCVDFTVDSREKAVKKKMLCVRYMNSTLTNDAISELVLLSRGVRRPPSGYTLVGELNNMALCYKMSSFKSSLTQNQALQGHAQTLYGLPNSADKTLNMTSVGSALPYPVAPSGQHNSNHYPLDRSFSSLGRGTVTPLAGVPWQINPKYADFDNSMDIVIPQIRYKSIMDIEREYDYPFVIERSAAARLPPDFN